MKPKQAAGYHTLRFAGLFNLTIPMRCAFGIGASLINERQPFLTTTLQVKESKNGCTFGIQVTPRASRAEIAGLQEGMLRLKVTALPVEGAANEACIKLLAKELGLKKSQMEIFTGTKSRKKVVLVKDIEMEELTRKISHLK
jgi:uncharacterized protein